MQRDPRQYTDAARVLWDLAPERLANLASGELTATQSVRDAARLALGVKREYLSPEEFGSERAALDRLAATLAMLPDFSLQEIAITAGRGPIRRTSQAGTAGSPPARSRRRILRVVLLASSLLLALEALARAGVPVMSPIEVIVDELGGEPRPSESARGPAPWMDPEEVSSQREAGGLTVPAYDVSRAGRRSRAPRPSRGRTKAKNENHAQGRDGQKKARPRKQVPVAFPVQRIVGNAASNARDAARSHMPDRGPRGSRGKGRSK